MGLGEFVWWVGVIEDVNDPLQLGRCRVRIAGFHGDVPPAGTLPTRDLPWAHPILPLNNPDPHTPPVGTRVCGFFRDGRAAQEPVMWGVLPRIT
jgi:hypothetical protein